MVWTKSKGFSKSEIDSAGSILINKESSSEEKEKALEILDNRRAIHGYPLHILKKD